MTAAVEGDGVAGVVKVVKAAVVAGGRGVGLGLIALVGSVPLFALAVVSLALIPVGVGLLVTPYALDLVRRHAGNRRLLAARWAGVRVPGAHRATAGDPGGGFAAVSGRCVRMLRDPATWRDLRWLLVDMTAGAVVALAGPALVLYGAFGLLLGAGLWIPVTAVEDPFWYGFVPVAGWGTGAFAALLGLAFLAVAPKAAPALVRVHFQLVRAVLHPHRLGELERRIDRLTETRHDALDASAAELRRIERDLHDGAQARLVAVGMGLGVVETLVEKDPARAKELIAAARESSAEALAELRDLVRGVHPPVLAERGLGDAVRALALRLPVPTEVEAGALGRFEAPVESAAYFSVSEVLTNAVKHAGADRIRVGLSYAEGSLRIAVADDGRGGARLETDAGARTPSGGGGFGDGAGADADAGGRTPSGGGTGLRGVERRLGAFDGVLAVGSPAGGPTLVTMEIPCASC